MLQHLREKAQGVVAGIVISVLIFMFAILGINSYISSHSQEKDVASVGGKKITQKEFEDQLNQLKHYKRVALGADFVLDDKTQQALRKEALNVLTNAYAMTNALYHEGFRISKGQLESIIKQDPLFQNDHQFSPSRYQAYFNRTGIDESTYESMKRQEAMYEQLKAGLVSSDFVLDNEFIQEIQLADESREAAVLRLPDSIKLNTSVPTEAQITDYYNKHMPDFTEPEQVKISYIQISLPAIEAKIHPTNQTLQTYFEKHQGEFVTPDQWNAVVYTITPVEASMSDEKLKKLAMSVLNNIKKDPLNKVESQYDTSDLIKVSAQRQPHLTLDKVGLEMANALQLLKNDKKSTSPLIQTPTGYAIIRVKQFTPGVVPTFAEVATQVKASYVQKEALKQFNTLSETLTNVTYESPDSLEPAAKATGLPISVSGFVTNKGEESGVFSKPNIIAGAFSADVLVDGNNSALLQVDSHTQVVLRVKEHRLAHVRPLSEVKTKVIRILERRAGEKHAAKLAADLSEQAAKASNLSVFAKQNHLTLSKSRWYKRSDQSLSPDVLDALFLMPSPEEGQPATTKAVQDDSGHFFVVIYFARKSGDLSAYKKELLTSIREHIADRKGRLAYLLFEEWVKDSARIKVYEQTLESA